MAWESRYVGNLRALNAALLDAYLLKSLDGGFEDNAVTTEKMSFSRCTPLSL